MTDAIEEAESKGASESFLPQSNNPNWEFVMRRRNIAAAFLATVVLLPPPASAQSAQLWSLQFSGRGYFDPFPFDSVGVQVAGGASSITIAEGA